MVAMAITSQGTRPVIKGVVRLEEAALSDHAYTSHARDRCCVAPMGAVDRHCSVGDIAEVLGAAKPCCGETPGNRPTRHSLAA